MGMHRMRGMQEKQRNSKLWSVLLRLYAHRIWTRKITMNV